MQVRATIQAASDFDAYAGIVHDTQCYAVNFAYENKTLLLLLLGEREEDASLEIRFYGVLGYEMTSCDFWGPSPHVFGWSLVPDNERTLLPRYLAEAGEYGYDQTGLQRNQEYMEIEVQFTSGDTLAVLCCSITIQQKRYPCPCCGWLTYRVSASQDQGYICPVCFWENDPFIVSDLQPSDSNHGLTLEQARMNYRTIGAVEQAMLPHVRLPLECEKP